MWFVTVVETIIENSEYLNGMTDTGVFRAWGFYSDKEKAIQSLHENWTNMRDDFYDYALIEEYEEGIANVTGNRQWFKWDEKRLGYFEIEEPNGVEDIDCFALG